MAITNHKQVSVANVDTAGNKKTGFTVIEIMAVIAIIGILVSIVVVLYPGYQQRARNTERKNDISQLATAINAYALQKNDYMSAGSGCGVLGGGSGWIALGPSDGGGFYPKSILTCLRETGVISNESDFFDPSGCKANTGGACTVPTTAYMKATCTKNGAAITYFMGHLEGEPRKDAEVDALCDVGSVPWFDANGQKWGTNYGMNYYVVAK